MKNTKISRRSFLLGLAACSAAGVLTACSGSSEPASSASTAPEPPASSAASEVTAAPFLTVEDFPALDGSTACIPLMAQMLADTTGMDLEEAQSIISVSTTAYAWESFGLYNTDTKMLVVYEAPDSVKEELEAANVQLEQKPIGVDALVFIVNEDNPVTDLTQQQLRDIYAGKITNWKDVGGQDLDIVAFQRRSDSGSQTLFQKLLIQGGELMDPPTELAPTAMGELVDSLAAYNNSANAIGFSVYYYIDQLYSQPGLRLLSVDGVMPSNDTLADGSYPLCNDFYAVIRPDATADSPERQLYDWLDTEAGQACIKKAGYVPAGSAKICRIFYSRMPKGRSCYGTSRFACGKPLAHPAAQPHHSGVQPAGDPALRAGAHWSAAQRRAAHPVDARPADRRQRGGDPHLSGAQSGHRDRYRVHQDAGQAQPRQQSGSTALRHCPPSGGGP